MEANIRPMVRQILLERERLLRIAETLAERFMAEHRKSLKRDKSDWGAHGIRVRRNNASLSVQWFRSYFPLKPGGGRLIHNVYLKRGRGHKQTAYSFRGMRQWERTLAIELEEELAYIRARASQLTTLMKSVKAYKREADRYDQLYRATLEETDFVDLDENIEEAVEQALSGAGRE